MTAICAWCKKHLGEKEPLEVRTETHGICEACFAEMAERVRHDETPYLAEETLGEPQAWGTGFQEEETTVHHGGAANRTEKATAS
jgi:hypothetical protein